MAVDIRARVFCNLGEVISGGWSDDHCQGAGLIRCRGDVVLKGTRHVAVGTAVQLAYLSPSGRSSQFPRQFRVLSCFANAYARTTTLQLGCTLTYLENIKAATDADRFFYSKEDPENKDLDCRLYDIALLPISARSIAIRCQVALGIGGETSLTNYYAAERFDLQEGYVSVLNDLLYAEGKVGFMSDLTTLRVVDLATYGSTGGSAAVATDSNIIELGSIGGGEVPADAVAVSYSYKKYKLPDPTKDPTPQERWEKEETFGELKKFTLKYTAGTYEAVASTYTVVETKYDRFNRKKISTTMVERHLADVNPNYITTLLDARELYPEIDIIIAPVIDYTEEILDYEREADELEDAPGETAGECIEKLKNANFYDPERDDQPIRKRTYTYTSDTAIAGSLSIEQYHFIDPATNELTVFHPGTEASRLVVYEEVSYESYRQTSDSSNKTRNPDLDVTKTVTSNKRAFYLVAQGQQSSNQEISTLNYDNGSQLQELIDRMSQLYEDGTQVVLFTSPDFGAEKRPDPAALSDQRNVKSVRAIEDESVVEFLSGNKDTKNVRVYQLPLAPDDRILYLGGSYPGTWGVTASDHKQKALKFARVQRAVSFGHTNGVSVQLPVYDMPPYPLDALAISGAGATGAFRVDGISWSFDANGIVCNADCLAWGGLGLTS